MHLFVALLIAFGLLFLPPALTANDPDATEASPAATAVADEAGGEESAAEAALTGTRKILHGSAHWLVMNVDSWFGDKPFEDAGRVEGLLRVRGLYQEDEGFRTDLRYRLQVRMPNVSERGYAFLGRDNEQETIQDEPEAFRRAQRLRQDTRDEDQTFFAGLGYLLRDNLDLRLGVRSGIRPYAQARYRKGWWLTDAANVEFRQTVFLAVRDGLGTTTSVDYAQALNTRTALRWRNTATISTETEGAAWATSVGLFQALRGQREWSLEALANGATGEQVGVREYGVRGIWSQPLYEDWVIGEVILGHFWPRDDVDLERQQYWAGGLGLITHF